jgi:hypothetical protein
MQAAGGIQGTLPIQRPLLRREPVKHREQVDASSG